ncbi:MAG: TRAP transporter large permease subunit [Proteobacteria bacterium]|nr:TRAP transporter large permease subunit [Pseudomonadota bacterium]
MTLIVADTAPALYFGTRVRFKSVQAARAGAIAAWIASVSSDPTVILAMINVFLLVIGIFMEPLPALFILIPVLVPVVQAVGIDLVHFGLVMVFNLCLGLITPPVGTVLNVVSGVARITLDDAFKGVMPFFLAQLAVLFTLVLFPDIVLVPLKWLLR